MATGDRGNHLGHHLFDSPLGRCGIAWNEQGIRRLLLPDTEEALRLALADTGPARAPSPMAARVVAQVTRHLAGKPQPLERAPLDLAGVPEFHRRVYRQLRTVPAGTTVSYADLARQAGRPGAARAVGQAMRRNPVLLLVPCHRVTAADGRPGGFSAAGGLVTKERLLLLEGVGRASDGARRLGLLYDPRRAVRHLRTTDPALAPHLRRLGPFTPRPTPRLSPFASLLSAIVYQQLSGKAAATILRRVRALFAPRRFPGPDDIHRAREADLRAAGLSRNKVAAARDLAAKTLDGTVPTLTQLRRLDDEAIVERLTAVRGIGRWTAEMLLLRLGRPDVLPIHDLGVRKGFARTVGDGVLPSTENLAAYGERWRPYRSVASWYLWRAVDQAPS